MSTEYAKPDQDFLIKFGKRLRELRQELTGLSQEKFAAVCKMDRTYISDIERGERNISLINVRKLAKALKVKPFELLQF